MDFLLDPNIAYLVLMAGVLMIMMALATPGTGFLELGGIASLLLTAYAIYRLSFNGWALIVLVLSVVPFIYALRAPKREMYLGLSLLLLVIGSVFLFPSTGGPSVNPWVALLTSLMVTGYLWIAIRKSLEASFAMPAHDLDHLHGQLGHARTVVHEDGSVQVAGELWSARSSDSIPAGSQVRVVGRDGFVVIVEQVH